MNLFVVGLPRSRTAWLSVFLSQSSTHFYHDGFNGCHSLDEYKEKIFGHGDCSTGLSMIDVNLELPDSKVVVIVKDEEELNRCIEWCTETYGVDSTDIVMSLKKGLDKIKGLRIKQSAINENLQKIWEYLLPDKWNEKYSDMINFNIQVNDPNNIDADAAGDLYASIQ